MRQSQFEQRYQPQWHRLEQGLTALEKKQRPKNVDLSRFTGDYQDLCHQLALSRERGYSLVLQDYLNDLMLRAHRQLYRHRAPLMPRLAAFLRGDFPRAVRSMWRWHLISALAFLLSAGLVAAMILHDPELVHTVVDGNGVSDLENMYHPDLRDSSDRNRADDLMMFGYYIYNNVGIAFRTFAGGVLFGIGSLVVMLFNGSFLGAAAAHLTLVGAGQPFYTFVIAHGAPELTAIVLAGGAGLRLGWSLVAPGSWRRVDALRRAARETLPVMYGVFLLLVLAAMIEAFWSSRELDAQIKYTVGGISWALLYVYLLFAGRHGSE
ncbi:stage II sporulation protein M [Alcanivoracaceae bacterium MT1]